MEREVETARAAGAAAVEATEAVRAAGQEAEVTGVVVVEATEVAVERELGAVRAAKAKEEVAVQAVSAVGTFLFAQSRPTPPLFRLLTYMSFVRLSPTNTHSGGHWALLLSDIAPCMASG